MSNDEEQSEPDNGQSLNWDRLLELPPEAMYHNIKNINKVPSEHKEAAQEKAMKLSTDKRRDFLNIHESDVMEFKYPKQIHLDIWLETQDVVGSKIIEEANDIINSVDKTEKYPLSNPSDQLLISVYLLHSLLISHAEDVLTVFLEQYVPFKRSASRVITDEDISHQIFLEWLHEETDDVLDSSEPIESQLGIGMEWLQKQTIDNLSTGLLKLGMIPDAVYDPVETVRSDRNDFVHAPHCLISSVKFETGADLIRRANKCKKGVKELYQLRLDYIPSGWLYEEKYRGRLD
jgi:hypothetical protein